MRIEDVIIKVDKAFNSKMTEVFQGTDIDEILNIMFAHIKAQVGKSCITEKWLYVGSNFTPRY